MGGWLFALHAFSFGLPSGLILYFPLDHNYIPSFNGLMGGRIVFLVDPSSRQAFTFLYFIIA